MSSGKGRRGYTRKVTEREIGAAGAAKKVISLT